MRLSDSQRLHGLVTATHTPFRADGSLNLAAVERQAEHLLAAGVTQVFIGGSTGESASLTLKEREALAERWTEVALGTPLRVVVHVGGNCLADARTLAGQAQALGAAAIAAVSPSYFKPRTVEDLVASMAEIASGAPELPFYCYDIPVMTGVNLPMPAFLEKGSERIPNLVGLKFTNPDLVAYSECIRAEDGRWDVPFGHDEMMLCALALGGRGAVGSSFNLAAPVYLRLLSAFQRGDLAAAREEQWHSMRLIKLLFTYGYLAATKAAMKILGVDVGPVRLPNATLSPEQTNKLRADLETLGFFGWIE